MLKYHINTVPLQQIFFVQAIDHLLPISLGLIINFSGLTLFANNYNELLQIAGWSYWVGFLGVLFTMELLYRIFAYVFFGHTLGQALCRAKPHFSMKEREIILGQFWEASHVVFPAFWGLDLLMRHFGYPIFMRYSYRYSELS